MLIILLHFSAGFNHSAQVIRMFMGQCFQHFPTFPLFLTTFRSAIYLMF